jgi:hypothetical protein
MSTFLSEELVRGHQADRRADAERWRRAAEARPAPHTHGTPGRARSQLAAALHAVAHRLEAGGTAVP